MTHPITPPPELLTLSPELLTRWKNDWLNGIEDADELLVNAYAAGALAGADQELEACCEWLRERCTMAPIPEQIRAARRPKPPSLKELALAVLENEPEADDMKELVVFDVDQIEIIRRALEQLDD